MRRVWLLVLSLWATGLLTAGGEMAWAEAPGPAARGTEPGYRALGEELVALAEARKGNAVIDWINAHGHGFAERDQRDPAWAAKHRESCQRYLDSAGPLQGHATLSDRAVGDRLAAVSWVLFGDQRPLVISATFYRRGDGRWQVQGWSWGADIQKLLDPAWPGGDGK